MPSPAPTQDLSALLHRTFGHTAFRANQQAVCEAAAAGEDVLLVMPTGAGKSLCYQLPALARQVAGIHSAALVISPLIALMDDQAAKLSSLGLRVARIHSGLSRDDSRQACRDYLAGTLDFLFIAPERLRVPGFPEMLAKRKPSLVAIDEAHCISAWGHDFRPDYRTLGDHLPSLRPAPVIALTATATPTVQRDIVAQLNLQSPSLFIHGFRRHNLAIEVVELSKSQRPEFVAKLLKPESARPAIVYAPSRKAAEELASRLGGTAAAYHAGLDPATRERVQRHFLSGKIDVVVATIAFGMGIDKADVRTVIHTALPASVEAYYQEIGRAGRDGQPSRTVLLHSFADRKMHDFFLERDYPAATELARVYRLLTPDLQPPGDLGRRLKMDSETLANALGKLASQGAASLDFDGNVRSTGVTGWQKGYDAQLAFRRSQIDRMAAFAESPQCRMLALIQHFGDTSDTSKPCGVCDFCNPTSTTGSSFREPTSQEQRHLRSILRALEGNGRSTGKLFTDLALTRDRKKFDGWLDALARAGYLTLTSETFLSRDEKDAGREIAYKKATLTHEGRNLEPGDLVIHLRDTAPAPTKSRSRTTRSSSGGDREAASDIAAADQARRVDRKQREAEKAERTASLNPAQRALETTIRAWRTAEATRLGKPPFILLSDRTLLDIALAQPRTLADLRRINGIGPEKSETYGPALIALCRESQPSPSAAAPPNAPAARPSALSPRVPLPTSNRAQDPRPLSRAERREPAPATGARPTSRLSTEPASAPPRPAPPPEAPFTPTQQTLDTRLRAWRAAEATRSGLPQFFVLPATTLRSVVLQHPRTLADLRRIEGIGPEKADRHGPDILKICNDEVND